VCICVCVWWWWVLLNRGTCSSVVVGLMAEHVRASVCVYACVCVCGFIEEHALLWGEGGLIEEHVLLCVCEVEGCNYLEWQYMSLRRGLIFLM
jgi:hypothetical protein